MQNPNWLSYRERGSVFGYRLIGHLTRLVGRPLVRALLYPICLYFILFAGATRRASRQYLKQLFGREPRWREVFRHHHTFAATILDRFYLYTKRYDLFDVTTHGIEVVKRVVDSGRGCLMLSAHLGSHEFMRAASLQHSVIVHMMMYEHNAQIIGAFADAADAQAKRRVISIGDIDALIHASECIDRGELVGILADRAVSNERLVPASFLGRPVQLPAGPFEAAAALKVPVILFFCLYRGGNRYEIYFEQLAEKITLPRRRHEALIPWAQRYAERLEHYCRLAPYNWFNFYDFWYHAGSNPRSLTKPIAA